MRTDTIFYQLFQSYPSLLFELVRLPTETAQGYQFTSAEIKELACSCHLPQQKHRTTKVIALQRVIYQ